MAATVQATTGTARAPAASTTAQNPHLKRAVYSKYRELLGSYNGKANAIIDTLPAYMVQEDRGFHFEPHMLHQVDSVLNFSGGRGIATAPPSQMYEAPACVQSAMMTKDKKPFTYTPGGIDLSQIKSERMAKRLARNAQAEGATGGPQPNRPPSVYAPGGGPVATNMGAAAMGMPFQVLPTAVPPPPSPALAGKQCYANGGVGSSLHPPTTLPPPTTTPTTTPTPQLPLPPLPPPPPPPPPPPSSTTTTTSSSSPSSASHSSTLAVTPSGARKSPTPQRFEPPPIGLRPEIKIPPNPMAALKKITPPVEKNHFWMDEYRKERSKSPMTVDADATRTWPSGTFNVSHNDDMQRSISAQGACEPPSPPRPEFRSVAPPQSPVVSVYTPVSQSPRSPDSAYNNKYAQQQQQQQWTPATATTSTTPSPTGSQSSQTSQSVPWRVQRNNVQQQPTVQLQQQQQQQQPIYNNVGRTPVPSSGPESQSSGQSRPSPFHQGPKPTNVGTLYIAPLTNAEMPTQPPTVASPSRQQQPAPARWMTSQPIRKEQPEWARPEDNGNVVPSSLHQGKSTLQQQQQQQQLSPTPGNGAVKMNEQNFGAHNAIPGGLRLQINAAGVGNTTNAKEHIIPIQLEKTPTPPTHTAAPSGFPQLPTMAHAPLNNGPSGYVMRTPNQFVDQGYNNYPSQREPSVGRVVSPNQQASHGATSGHGPTSPINTETATGPRTRIIPIAVEGQSNESGRGPIARTPVIIQNDQRTPPVQSKSFRILQKITDTVDNDVNGGAGECKSAHATDGDGEPQLHKPQYARQMSAQQALNGATIEQMKRLQIAQEQQQQQQQQRNQGNQNANRQQQQSNKYMQQRSTNGTEDIPQQYIHPSEQHVPEPKKYTGSAIPSRSFKILQAMTTPENAGPGQSDL